MSKKMAEKERENFEDYTVLEILRLCADTEGGECRLTSEQCQRILKIFDVTAGER